MQSDKPPFYDGMSTYLPYFYNFISKSFFLILGQVMDSTISGTSRKYTIDKSKLSRSIYSRSKFLVFPVILSIFGA